MKAIEAIPKYIHYVSRGILNAVIYIFPNTDVVQFCDKDDLFELESVKLYYDKPNIKVFNYLSRQNYKSKFIYIYDGIKITETLSDVITGKLSNEIIKVYINSYSNYTREEILSIACKKFNLKMDNYEIKYRNFVKWLLAKLGK